MYKTFLRWVLPIVALLVIATILVLSPLVYTYAAAPSTHTRTNAPAIQQQYEPTPDILMQDY